MFPSKQLTLSDIYADCLDSFDFDKPIFLSLLEQNIDIDSLIPLSLRWNYHAWYGRPREYPLTGFLWALILQRILSIPTDSLLILFLRFSRELREFCGFSKVPDASKFTRSPASFGLSSYSASLAYLQTVCSSFSSASQGNCVNSAASARSLMHPSLRASSKDSERSSRICSISLSISQSLFVKEWIQSLRL